MAKRPITIRPAQPQDIPIIHSITQEAFYKYARDLGMPQLVAALKETPETLEKELKEKRILVGLLDGEPVGSIRFEVLPNNIAYLSRFGVRLIAQGCGMGHALVKAVENECRALGMHAIVLHTSARMGSLIRFYYGCGFFVHSVETSRGYYRAQLCRELDAPDGFRLEDVYPAK